RSRWIRTRLGDQRFDQLSVDLQDWSLVRLSAYDIGLLGADDSRIRRARAQGYDPGCLAQNQLSGASLAVDSALCQLSAPRFGRGIVRVHGYDRRNSIARETPRAPATLAIGERRGG